MQLVLHTGAHFTEEDRLLKCLLRNKGDFAKRGVAVPGPSTYRRLLRDTLNALKDNEPALTAREVLLDAMLDNAEADRIILSNAHLYGPPRVAARNGQFYPFAEEKLVRLARIFPEDQIEIYIALRNPATFLPALSSKVPELTEADFLGASALTDLRWSQFIARMRMAAPHVQITVWCNEDAPLIWGEIIRDMAGLLPGEKIVGAFDLLSDIMTKDGMLRFRSYLKSHPDMTEIQKRRVMAAFLDKFAIEDRIEEELDLAGWTDDLVETLTEVYDEDVAEIARMPGVEMIAP